MLHPRLSLIICGIGQTRQSRAPLYHRLPPCLNGPVQARRIRQVRSPGVFILPSTEADGRPPQTPGSKVNFRGDDGNECEDFIQSVRIYAFEKGKHEDPKWMASYAATRLSGPALRWHSQLNTEIKKDWASLESALLEKYPAVPTAGKTG